MTMQAYFDESGDTHAGQKTMIIGGYISTKENWDKFSDEWTAQLQNDKRPFFKIGKANSNKTIRTNEKYYRIIEKHILASVYCIVEVQDLHKAADDFQWPPANTFENFEDFKRYAKNPYSAAFVEICRLLIERQNDLGIFEPINMVFDERTEFKSLLEGHQFLKYCVPMVFKELVREPTFGNDKVVIPLQAAELYAGWLRKGYLKNLNLKTGHPFSWSVKPHMNLYIHLKYDFFMKKFAELNSQEFKDIYSQYSIVAKKSLTHFISSCPVHH